MANIFNKTIEDYKHLMAYCKLNKVSNLDALNSGLTGYKHDFRVINRGRRIGVVQDSAKASIKDAAAQSMEYVTSNLEAIQAEIEEILYSDFRLDNYFPIISNIPEGAQTYHYQVVDKQGRGTFIENYGTNAQKAHITVQKVPYTLKLGGLIASWTYEDIRAAQFANIPLQNETIVAATEGALDHIEQIGVGTDTSGVFRGLINMVDVPVTLAPANWTTITPTQLITEINGYITQIISQTNEIFGRKIRDELCLYVPHDIHGYLTGTPRSDTTDTTIWTYLERNNSWTPISQSPFTLRDVAELSTAGGGSTRRALLGYPSSRKVWEMAMPISPRVMNVVEEYYSVSTPLEYKISGLNVKRPGGMLYIDGI